MPGLVPAAGTQAVSRSRRQSHAGPDVPWGWCRGLEAGAEDMAVGHPAAAETPSPCTSPARTYTGDREHWVTSASCAHAGLTAALRPPKARPCLTHDSKGKPVPPLFPTHASRVSREKQGPPLCHCQPPTLGVCGSWGHWPGLLMGAHGWHVGTHRDNNWARVSRGLQLFPAWG